MAKQKIQASTQKFTQLKDIIDNIVLFHDGNASLVIEVMSTNFALLSLDEQEAKVQAYAAFLNSLTSPVQIIINNRRLNITSYINLLESEIEKLQDPIVIQYMQLYKLFIQDLVKQNVVLDKRFYIVIPYSYLEVGAMQTISSATIPGSQDKNILIIKTSLHSKADAIRNQLSRMNLQTKILEKDELISLFHQMYNPEESTSSQNAINVGSSVVDEGK